MTTKNYYSKKLLIRQRKEVDTVLDLVHGLIQSEEFKQMSPKVRSLFHQHMAIKRTEYDLLSEMIEALPDRK